jgi:AcrR family transcriptional regulator
MNAETDLPLPLRLPLTRERVLHAAISIADASGVAALSMRRLAQNLGVEAMSLYNHVSNKEDLLDGMVDLVVAEMAVPDVAAPWLFEIRRTACSAHEVLIRHPWAPLLLVSRINVGPAKLRHFDATHGCFLNAGFSHPMADQARNVIDGHLYGFTLQKLLFPLAAGTYAETAKQFLPMLPREVYPHMRALTEQVIDGSYDGLHQFEFGLDLILRSLEDVWLKLGIGTAEEHAVG